MSTPRLDQTDINLPEHLPARLTITLWDFSWYTQAGPGEPFADLDAAMTQAVDRGYNTIRICAMPYLLFGEHDIDPGQLEIAPMAPGVGAGTRWYNVQGGVRIDGRARLLALFESARRHQVHVIVSSWEYQQSPAFSADDRWYRSLAAVPPKDRFLTLARCLARLVEYLRDHGLDEQIAYLEIHNEVDVSRLRYVPNGENDPYLPQRSYNEEAIEWLKGQCPDQLITTCYGIVPHLDMGVAAQNVDVAHFHIYVYGALGALDQWAGVRSSSPTFPSEELRSLLRDNAPSYSSDRDPVPSWRYQATGILPSMFYSYDYADPIRWDRWLYDHHHLYAEAMRWAISDRLESISKFARAHGVPAVIGEGWIGYTPLYSGYEDGPIGTAIAEHGVSRAIELGFWGVVLGSNSAPHHPGWANVDWQRRLNRTVLESAVR